MAVQIDWSRKDTGHDEAFVGAVTPDVARRQLHMSLGLMGALAAAIVALVATTGLPTHAGNPAVVTAFSVQQPQFVRPMTAAATASEPRI